MWCDWNTMGWFGWSMMVVFWGAVIVALVWGLRTVRDSGSRPSNSAFDALDVLERRFAQGEIDREEFEERRRILEERRNPAR